MPETTIELSGQQQKAMELATQWYTAKEKKQIFRLFGYAGTGKTTITKTIIKKLALITPGLVVGFGAYTGKAALVMKKQGLPAQTLHSLIYKVVPPNAQECERLYKLVKEGKEEYRTKLQEAQKVRFTLNTESDLFNMDLLVLDECSMVNEELLTDLLSFKVPILVLGDPGQLPPIEGAGALLKESPDITLTEIHRQSADSPIIGFATRARIGSSLPFSKVGAAQHFEVCSFYDLKPYLTGEWQVLTGKNTTRRKLNKLIRPGKTPYPEVGERLICLRNDRDVGLYNGLMVEVTKVGEIYDNFIDLEIQSELEDSKPQLVRALRAYFDEYLSEGVLKDVKWWQRKDTQEFDFGYAITVHKAQGSQWDKVVLADDNFYAWEKSMRKLWLYTAITRAAEELVVIKGVKNATLG